ncbi:MAG: type IV secretory system conjugative DNA transfer family protein [Solirubrobacteraceae bacterium]|jgi:type IV secretory pathway TraG/TraD family ATPase VirD4
MVIDLLAQASPYGSGSLPIEVLTGGGLAAYGAWRAVRRIRGGRDGQGAEWADGRDLKPLRVRGPAPGRIVLGRHQGALIATHERSSCLIAGLTQHAYKTSGLIIPNVLEWRAPVISTSVKGDVLRATVKRRGEVGKVKVFDPAGMYDGVPHGTWSPIHATGGGWRQARKVADALVQVGVEPSGISSENDRHFRGRSSELLGPLLLAAYHGPKTMGDVLSWIKHGEFTQPVQLLKRSGVDGYQAAVDNITLVSSSHDEYKMSVFNTLAQSLAAWQDPSVLHATNESDITVEWLLGGKGHNTLYVVGTEEEQEVLAPLFGALVAHLIGGLLEHAERQQAGHLDRAVLVALDEVANTCPVGALDRYASAGASRGVQLLTAVQNLAQLKLRYGDAKAETILANHAAKLLCAGLNDPASLQYVEKVVGQQHVTRRSRHAPSGLLAAGGRSTTVAEQLEPLIPPHQLREAREATALLIYGRTPPLWVDLRRYYLDKRLCALASGAADAAGARNGNRVTLRSCVARAVSYGHRKWQKGDSNGGAQ